MASRSSGLSTLLTALAASGMSCHDEIEQFLELVRDVSLSISSPRHVVAIAKFVVPIF